MQHFSLPIHTGRCSPLSGYNNWCSCWCSYVRVKRSCDISSITLTRCEYTCLHCAIASGGMLIVNGHVAWQKAVLYIRVGAGVAGADDAVVGGT